MATLQRIRNRAGLLIAVVIGMAIFAFILQDMLGSGKSALAKNKFVFAEIDGKTVPYEEFASRYDKLAEYYTLRMGTSSLDEETNQSIREQTWQDIVREYTTMDEYKELGVGVSTDEVMDMVQGRNPHPIITSLFSDPETGVMNRSFLVQFIRTMDEDPSGAQKTIWLYLENEIIKDRAFSKYNNLIRKGLYVTSAEAELNYQESNRRFDISYLARNFATVPDTAISYSDSDMEKYYKEHKNEYQQAATRDIEYLVYEVVPSPEDREAAQNWINRIKGEFETAEDPVPLVNLESDIPYENRNYMKGELSPTIDEFMFSAQPGDTYGPYEENGAFNIARLVEINYLPDSVRARHILLQPSQQVDAKVVRYMADSLFGLLQNGADFGLLAQQFSMDGSNAQGGDLGWFAEGQMVGPFNDSCFNSPLGKLMKVESKFGIHIVEVTDKKKDVKKVKVALMSRNIEASSETYSMKYSEAVEFAGMNNNLEKFNASVAEKNLTKRYATDVAASQQTITGLDQPRALIRWAFEAKLNEVSSEVFEFGNKYVVAIVTGIREKGIAPMEMVRAEIELEVRKTKKAEKIIAEFNQQLEGASTVDELAGKMNLRRQEASNLSFSSVSVSGAGIEPNIVAAASIIPARQLSKPIKGNNGVYVLMVNNLSEPAALNTDAEKARLSMMRQSQAGYEAYNALMEAAKIEDNRLKYF